VRIAELVSEVLLPRAAAGLDRFGVAPAYRDQLLGIIDERCRTGQNGAAWQTATVNAAELKRGMDRTSALHHMLSRYAELQRTNDPVHTWPID
jgi:hypothetical protein